MSSFKRDKIVIGLGFGDEGKGMFVDYLCSRSPYSLVVRFNGGHQVSHTVVTDETSHMFSNFGAGTLRGYPTYWSEKCTVNPESIVCEFEILKEKGVNPCIYVHKDCPITTPYDIEHNKNEELKNHHGSCGVGFGATINREESNYSLTFLDLFYPDVLKEKMRLIKRFYNSSLTKLDNFYVCCDILTNMKNVSKVSSMPKFESYIYEGAQGLLLDSKIGFFPNVTRSNTTFGNLCSMLAFMDECEIFLVTRAYQTRHGNGYMSNEDILHTIARNPRESNVPNIHQGDFRTALLDMSLLEYGLEKEDFIKRQENLNLVVTCLDHVVDNYRFTYEGKIVCCQNERDFINRISQILNIKSIYISRNSNSKHMEHTRIK